MNQRAIKSSYKKYTGFKYSKCKLKTQFLLKFSIIMNLKVIQCPCKREQTSYTTSVIRKCSPLLSTTPQFSTMTHYKSEGDSMPSQERTEFIHSLNNQETQYPMKFSTITDLRVSQCHCKKEKDFIHSLCIKKIQFLLNFSNIINLWVIQCRCKKQTSYILSEIRQCTAVTVFSAMHISGIFCVRIKNAE